jgi:protein-S-isoprenylcysteine O-methyltransferase Ste14
MIVLFFVVWGTDSFILNYSTLLVGFVLLPLRVFLSILSLGVGGFLVVRSHRAVFGDTDGKSELLDSGVYSLVRHPMYLGIWLFCWGFFLLVPSLFALVVLAILFVLYDRRATYEETHLTKVFGDRYLAYQRKVAKWFPRLGAKN